LLLAHEKQKEEVESSVYLLHEGSLENCYIFLFFFEKNFPFFLKYNYI
jgi:hypothetical protein